MLSVLLETMHEDCNSVSKKPYIEHKDSAGRSDDVIAAEFWSGFKERDPIARWRCLILILSRNDCKTPYPISL